MALPTNPQISRSLLQNVDKVKDYLINNLSRELEVNPPPVHQRREAITALLEEVYANTPLKLPETIRLQVFRDV